nr:carboxypeptidase-like regulatory domain-containing protein [Paraprevotella clara]
MNRAHKILSVLLLGSYGLGIQLLDAQTVSGRITDRESSPVTGAAVVLQTPDSIFVSAAVSDADGRFTLSAQPEQYRLIVQHLLYRSRTVNGTGKDVGTIVLQPADHTIGEVVVKAERPIVRVEEGRLNYDLEQIVRDKVVNNTYEALQRLPGVQEIGGKLTLAGAGDVTVILNGKLTTMDAGQLETLLRNTPVSRVEKVEVMYSTPPQYHVRGASLNVVLKRPNDYSFQGEVNASYDNCYFNAGNATGNFRFSTPKLALDAMYGIDRVHTMQYYNLFSRHTLDGQVYSIPESTYFL